MNSNTPTLEHSNTKKKERLFCLDVLRGLDIFYLTAINYGLLGGVFAIWNPTGWANVAFRHSLTAFQSPGHASTGFGLLDLAQPTFLFVTGVAASFAMAKRIGADGRPLRGFWTSLAKRTLMLWAIGSAICGMLTLSYDHGGFWPYANTLHTIAVGYFAAAVGMLVKNVWRRLALGLVLVAIPAVVQSTCGDWTQFGNASRLIDEKIIGWCGFHGKDFCYFLTTFSWAGVGVLASLVGEILKGNLEPRAKAKALGGVALGSLAVGAVAIVWIPAIRYIYTVSFVFLTFGIADALLLALYVVTDVFKWRRGWGLMMLYGQCSLAAWVLAMFFGSPLRAASARFVEGLPVVLGTDRWQAIAAGVVRIAVLTYLLYVWRKYRDAKRAERA